MKKHESQKMLVLNDNELDIVSGGGIDRGDRGRGDRSHGARGRGDRGDRGDRGGSRSGPGRRY